MLAPASAPALSTVPESRPSTIARLVIAPITFISFLISLALIDSHNSSLRSHYHSSTRAGPSHTIYGRTKQIVHDLVWKVEEEPYAYVKSPDAKSADALGRKDARSEPWHWNTKQKKMMKMEISDAFELRKSVVVVLITIVWAIATVAFWGVRSVFGLMMGRV